MNKKLYLIILTIIFLTACGRTNKSRQLYQATLTPEMLIVRPTRFIPTPIMSDISVTMTAVANKPKLMIRIDGMSYGNYGKDYLLNGGTTNEYKYIAYYVPSGTYTATNNRNYIDQISVLSAATQLQGIYEEPLDGKAYLFQPGETQTIYVSNGYYVKVVPPSDFTLVSK